MSDLDLDLLETLFAKVPERPWHAGRTVGRTVYDGDGPDDLIGVMDTRYLADCVITAHNILPALLARVRELEAQGAARQRRLQDVIRAEHRLQMAYGGRRDQRTKGFASRSQMQEWERRIEQARAGLVEAEKALAPDDLGGV